MMSKLSFNTFLKHCSYIHPLKRDETNSLEGISNLPLHVFTVLNVFSTVDNILLSDV